MPISAATLRKLATLSLSQEQMTGVLEILAEQQDAEEQRLAAQRERKARQRAGQSRDSHGTVTGQERDQSRDTPSPLPSPSPDKETSPLHPPKENNLFPDPTPQPRPSGVREAFDRFWAMYPNKVGKRDAMASFERAMKRTDLETMIEGLRLYVGKTDDRPWCNPATWLNQDRWTDRPAQVARASPPLRGIERVRAELQQEIFDAGYGGQESGDPQDVRGLSVIAFERH